MKGLMQYLHCNYSSLAVCKIWCYPLSRQRLGLKQQISRSVREEKTVQTILHRLKRHTAQLIKSSELRGRQNPSWLNVLFCNVGYQALLSDQENDFKKKMEAIHFRANQLLPGAKRNSNLGR